MTLRQDEQEHLLNKIFFTARAISQRQKRYAEKLNDYLDYQTDEKARAILATKLPLLPKLIQELNEYASLIEKTYQGEKDPDPVSLMQTAFDDILKNNKLMEINHETQAHLNSAFTLLKSYEEKFPLVPWEERPKELHATTNAIGVLNSLEIGVRKVNDEALAEQFAQDAAVWDKYLTADPTSGNAQMMTRLFSVIQYGDLHYRCKGSDTYESVGKENKKTTQDHRPPLNLAAALSHGGRILIEVPPLKEGEVQSSFVDWLMYGREGTPQPALFKRLAATHSATINSNPDKGKVSIIEKKVNPILDLPTLIKDSKNERHYGLNLGLGDITKPLEVVQEDGKNGHLYIFYVPPTATSPGCIEVGAEGCAPGKTSRYGDSHGITGKSSDTSPTGSSKFRDFGDYPIKPDKTNGLMIRLNDKMMTTIKNNAETFTTDALYAPITKDGQLPPPAEQEALRAKNKELVRSLVDKKSARMIKQKGRLKKILNFFAKPFFSLELSAKEVSSKELHTDFDDNLTKTMRPGKPK